MNDDTLRVAVIGAGRAGQIHARNYAQRIDHASLAAVVDANEHAARSVASELGVDRYHSDYRWVMKQEDVDAVVIVTPTVLHREITVAAAKAGKHVFCEKPMAMSTEECTEMNEAANQAGVKLQIGFMRRFDRNFLAAKEAIDGGEIGDVVMVRSLTHGPSTPREWMYDIRKSNGPLAELNSHDIDTVRWFTESDASEVYAIAGNYRNPQAREQYPDFYDNVVMTVRLTDGSQGIVEGAAAVRYGYDSRVEVLGTDGLITVGQLPDTNVVVSSKSGNTWQKTVPSWRNLFEDAYHAEATSFVEAIRNDETPRVTGRDGQAAVEMVIAGNTSIIEKKPIRVSGA